MTRYNYVSKADYKSFREKNKDFIEVDTSKHHIVGNRNVGNEPYMECLVDVDYDKVVGFHVCKTGNYILIDHKPEDMLHQITQVTQLAWYQFCMNNDGRLYFRSSPNDTACIINIFDADGHRVGYRECMNYPERDVFVLIDYQPDEILPSSIVANKTSNVTEFLTLQSPKEKWKEQEEDWQDDLQF